MRYLHVVLKAETSVQPKIAGEREIIATLGDMVGVQPWRAEQA
jgi:hypothetical protein